MKHISGIVHHNYCIKVDIENDFKYFLGKMAYFWLLFNPVKYSFLPMFTFTDKDPQKAVSNDCRPFGENWRQFWP